jgi:hypothetical protein
MVQTATNLMEDLLNQYRGLTLSAFRKMESEQKSQNILQTHHNILHPLYAQIGLLAQTSLCAVLPLPLTSIRRTEISVKEREFIRM